MRRKLLVLTSILALAAPALAESGEADGVAPPPAEDGRPPGPRHPRGGLRRHGPPPLDRILEKHAERLDLADETREQIRTISETARAERQGEHEKLRALHDSLRTLLREEAPDEAQVMDLADEIGAAETARRKKSLRTMLEIRGLLTPEQRAELVKIHAERETTRSRGRRDKRGTRDGEGPAPKP